MLSVSSEIVGTNGAISVGQPAQDRAGTDLQQQVDVAGQRGHRLGEAHRLPDLASQQVGQVDVGGQGLAGDRGHHPALHRCELAPGPGSLCSASAAGATSSEWKACDTGSRIAVSPCAAALAQTRSTASAGPDTTVCCGPL